MDSKRLFIPPRPLVWHNPVLIITLALTQLTLHQTLDMEVDTTLPVAIILPQRPTTQR